MSRVFHCKFYFQKTLLFQKWPSHISYISLNIFLERVTCTRNHLYIIVIYVTNVCIYIYICVMSISPHSLWLNSEVCFRASSQGNQDLRLPFKFRAEVCSRASSTFHSSSTFFEFSDELSRKLRLSRLLFLCVFENCLNVGGLI